MFIRLQFFQKKALLIKYNIKTYKKIYFFDNNNFFFLNLAYFFVIERLLLYGKNNILYYCRVSCNNDIQKSE